jgi:hypothetical protein
MHPLSLHEVQQAFWRSIARRPGESAIDPRFIASVSNGEPLDRIARIEVYSGAYFLRLKGVLAEDFPATARVLGEDRFDAMVRQYLRAFPSEHPSVRHLGRKMAEFLDARTDVPPYLGALARLEWLMNEVFDAPDAAALTIDDLRAIAPDRWPYLRFRSITALMLMRAEWPVHELWASGGAAVMRPALAWIRVWRDRNYNVFHAAIDAREAQALKRMVAGESFAAICGAYSDLSEEQAAREAVAKLMLWLECGLITAAE